MSFSCCSFFFFNDTATTEIYTLSLHDALPISCRRCPHRSAQTWSRRSDRNRRSSRSSHPARLPLPPPRSDRDRKSTRLNSSHLVISYAVFCLKKKKTTRATAAPTSYASSNDPPELGQFVVSHVLLLLLVFFF